MSGNSNSNNNKDNNKIRQGTNYIQNVISSLTRKIQQAETELTAANRASIELKEAKKNYVALHEEIKKEYAVFISYAKKIINLNNDAEITNLLYSIDATILDIIRRAKNQQEEYGFLSNLMFWKTKQKRVALNNLEAEYQSFTKQNASSSSFEWHPCKHNCVGKTEVYSRRVWGFI